MRIAIVVTARPSYAKVQTVIGALLKRGAEVHLLACASALLERYGRVVDVMRKDWPDVPIEEVWSTYEGATLLTSAKETGALLADLSLIYCDCPAGSSHCGRRSTRSSRCSAGSGLPARATRSRPGR
jgi:hypothetical protein